MSDDKSPPATREAEHSHTNDPGAEGGFSRRDFLKGGAAGLAVGGLVGTGVGARLPMSAQAQAGPPKGPDRMLLRGGIVLSTDPAVGDFEQADVLIEGRKIIAVGPNLPAGGEIVDCRGTIVMPGFISTHNHQYEAIQRSINADGLIVFAGDADQQPTDPTSAVYEAYGTVVQNIWTAGRLTGPPPASTVSGISGVLHTIQRIATSRNWWRVSVRSRRASPANGYVAVLPYAGAYRRHDQGPHGLRTPVALRLHRRHRPVGPDRRQPYEFPFPGLQRIAKKRYFTSKDQLVTLGFAGGPMPIANLPARTPG